MEIKKLLKNNFKYIENVFFEKKNNDYFLKIQVLFRSLDKISNASKEISVFLDKINFTNKNYFLDVFSPGAEKEIDLRNLKKFIGKNIYVELHKKIKDKIKFIGELFSLENNKIIIKWNLKGQIKKEKINIDNIKKIKNYIKINNKKEKHGIK